MMDNKTSISDYSVSYEVYYKKSLSDKMHLYSVHRDRDVSLSDFRKLCKKSYVDVSVFRVDERVQTNTFCIARFTRD